ncbi:hypothetical protein D9M71_317120 [compost metagenome]
MPGLLGQGQVQFAGQRLGHRQGLLAKGGQGAGGAAELQHQETRFQFGQALALAGERAEQAGELHAEGHRGGVLQPGASGQRRGGVTFGLGGEIVG